MEAVVVLRFCTCEAVTVECLSKILISYLLNCKSEKLPKSSKLSRNVNGFSTLTRIADRRKIKNNMLCLRMVLGHHKLTDELSVF